MNNNRNLNDDDFELNMVKGSSKVHSLSKEEIHDEIDHNAYLAIEGAKETRKKLIADDLREKGIDPSTVDIDAIVNGKGPHYKYYKVSSTLMTKIDIDNHKLYILDRELNQWREDPSLMAEFDHGDLRGIFVIFNDKYEIGEPWVFDPKRVRL